MLIAIFSGDKADNSMGSGHRVVRHSRSLDRLAAVDRGGYGKVLDKMDAVALLAQQLRLPHPAQHYPLQSPVQPGLLARPLAAARKNRIRNGAWPNLDVRAC
ncbi:MAG: hypothetical protein C0631_16345 [Sedimenticola sp.]|nr:MAG: hypothetical protein C0631_16345 [Sedimenticola sp.]